MTASGGQDWCVYMLLCSDDTLYTGITNDLERRTREHNHHRAGARYTRSRRPVALVYFETAASRSAALKREHRIRQLSTADKIRLIGGGPGRPADRAPLSPEAIARLRRARPAKAP